MGTIRKEAVTGGGMSLWKTEPDGEAGSQGNQSGVGISNQETEWGQKRQNISIHTYILACYIFILIASFKSEIKAAGHCSVSCVTQVSFFISSALSLLTSCHT
jgi:hypothetical protein